MRLFAFAALFFVFLVSPSFAHFGTLIPSKSIVVNQKDKNLNFTIAFTHPMEQNGMTMEKPKEFFAAVGGTKKDCTNLLKETKFLQHKAWTAQYTLDKPGVYAFGVSPQPYFEPAEDCYIVHYSKVYVPAFGEEEDWDASIGLPAEIIPLTRPFGNYGGSVFQGKVVVDGKVCPNCEVEVEFYNEGKKRTAPNPYFVTQVVKTDANGVFTFVAPWDGWWAFAALTEGAKKINYEGTPKRVEIGAILWVQFGGGKK